MSCLNLCLMMEMARSTGTDVKRAFTSKDALHLGTRCLLHDQWCHLLVSITFSKYNIFLVSLRNHAVCYGKSLSLLQYFSVYKYLERIFSSYIWI